jgi:hypothetical protein
VNLISLIEQKLGQVGSILPGNTGDQRSFFHEILPYGVGSSDCGYYR